MKVLHNCFSNNTKKPILNMNNEAGRAAATEKQRRRRRAQLKAEEREHIRNRNRERNLQTRLIMNDEQSAVYQENMRNRVQH